MEREQLVATVTAAQNGDSEALNLLFNTYYNDVYYFALKTLKDADLACDITQEAFVEIINTIGDLKAPEAFVTWMRQVTYHQCTRYFKKKKEVLVEEDEEGNSVFDTLEEEREEFIPGEGVDKEDFRATILALLDTLSEEQRAAVLMHYYHEMSVKEIAEAQKVSEGTVKSRLNYARKSMKKSVEDYEEKHDVKLHCAGVLPLLLWLFATAGKDAMPIAAANTLASGVTSATGVVVTVSAGGSATVTTVGATVGTGLMAKITALPMAVKIISGVTACALLIGSIAMTVSHGEKLDEEPTESSSVSTKQDPAKDIETIKPTLPDNLLSDAVGNIVPAGCTYTMNDGTILTEGQTMPKEMQNGEFLTTADYTYRYNGSDWDVRVRDTEKQQYGALYACINGGAVTRLENTFWGCTAMTVAPKIPNSVTSINSAFYQCSSLALAPEIPEGMQNMAYAFSYCESLVEAPQLPSSVSNMMGSFSHCKALVNTPEFPEQIMDLRYAFEYCVSLTTVAPLPSAATDLYSTFRGCTALVQAPIIPAGVKDMSCTFMGCQSLAEPPVIPMGVTGLNYTFAGCKSLVKAPNIPNGVTHMRYTFQNCSTLREAPVLPVSLTEMDGAFQRCKALVTAPEIPKGVKDLTETFGGCDALIVAPIIPDGVTSLRYTFSGCDSLVMVPVIPNSVEYMDNTFAGCISLTGTITINGRLLSAKECFAETLQSIVLTGNSPNLQELADTATEDNVTVA